VDLGGVLAAEDGLGAELGSVVVAEGVMVAEGVVLAVGEGGEGVAMWRFLLQTSTLTWTSTTRLRCKPARWLLHCLACIVLLVVIDGFDLVLIRLRFMLSI
jgi:hypothetical protein